MAQLNINMVEESEYWNNFKNNVLNPVTLSLLRLTASNQNLAEKDLSDKKPSKLDPIKRVIVMLVTSWCCWLKFGEFWCWWHLTNLVAKGHVKKSGCWWLKRSKRSHISCPTSVTNIEVKIVCESLIGRPYRHLFRFCNRFCSEVGKSFTKTITRRKNFGYLNRNRVISWFSDGNLSVNEISFERFHLYLWLVVIFGE